MVRICHRFCFLVHGLSFGMTTVTPLLAVRRERRAGDDGEMGLSPGDCSARGVSASQNVSLYPPPLSLLGAGEGNRSSGFGGGARPTRGRRVGDAAAGRTRVVDRPAWVGFCGHCNGRE